MSFIVLSFKMRRNVGYLVILFSQIAIISSLEIRNHLNKTLHYHEGIDDSKYIYSNISSDKKVRTISFIAYNRLFKLCLTEREYFYDESVVNDEHVKSCEWWSGNICDDIGSSVYGHVLDNKFFGKIMFSNGDVFHTENAKKHAWPIFEDKYHSAIYSHKDVNHEVFKNVSCPISHSPGWSSKTLSKLASKKGKIARMTVRSSENGAKYCAVNIYMHPSFVKLHGSPSLARISALNSIHAVNSIFKQTTIVGRKDVFALQIAAIKVLSGKDADDFEDEDDSSKAFELFRHLRDKYDDKSCKSILFISKIYDGGQLLGLATVGNMFSGRCHGRNSGLMVTSTFGTSGAIISLSDAHHAKVTAHEVGHTEGAWHDPSKECSRPSKECPNGQKDNECRGTWAYGSYLMAAYVSSITSRNSDVFSHCSENYMSVYFNSPHKDCLTAYKSHYCGNGIKEEGEECDAGDVNDGCCDEHCKLLPNMQCSYLNGECCTRSCKFKSATDVCQEESECRDEILCPGDSDSCVRSSHVYKKDNQPCTDGRAVCLKGECTGSACLLKNSQECLTENSNDICMVTCMDSATNQCKLYTDREGKTKNKVEGTACNDGKGYCTETGTCMNTLPDGKIFGIIENIFEKGLVNYLLEVFKTYIIIFSVTLTLIVLIILCLPIFWRVNKEAIHNQILLDKAREESLNPTLDEKEI